MKKLGFTSWVVWLTALMAAAFTALAVFVEGGARLPLQIMSIGFAFVASGYAGTDRIAQFVKTRSMEYGVADYGDPKRVQIVIWVSLLLVIESTALTLFTKGLMDLYVGAYVAAFSGASAAYAIGNKAIASAAATEGKKSIVASSIRFMSEKAPLADNIEEVNETAAPNDEV
jgi:hypothetical protein